MTTAVPSVMPAPTSSTLTELWSEYVVVRFPMQIDRVAAGTTQRQLPITPSRSVAPAQYMAPNLVRPVSRKAGAERLFDLTCLPIAAGMI